MKKIGLLFITLTLASLPALAAKDTTAVASPKEQLKTHLKQHFQLYGFIRNYFAYDSRESYAGTGDLYFFQPMDRQLTAQGQDLHAISTFRFLTLTTRLGLNIANYQWGRTQFGAKIEADFYTGLSGVGAQNHKLTGVAQLRLRQAYVTLAWDSLPMGKNMARVDLLMGQAWHPMAVDLPDVIALNSGAPFGPFSRTPQVKMDAHLGTYITLTGAAIWQMQYTSIGPAGLSAEYIAYSKTPEAYIGLSFHTKGWLVRVGADLLSIRPRHIGTNASGDTVRVKDRITTFSPYLYLQYRQGEFAIKAKTILAQAGEHMNMNGGYGVKAVRPDGTWTYTPTRTSSSWLSIIYGGKVGPDTRFAQKLQGILFAGYMLNLGTIDPLIDANGDGKWDIYYPRANNIRQMARVSPTILWTIGPFQLGCEYEMTTAQYGDNTNAHGLAQDNQHWVTNHRVQLMTKFNF